ENRIDNSWAQIDVQLRRRADLIPNLMETVKGYMTRIKRIKKYAVPLLVGAVRKAQRVAIAMESKSFGSYRDRTYLRQIEIKKSDIIYVTLNILIFAAILAILTINGITVWGYKSIR
ncbi:MAG: LemA family protein, partial [Candidatus Humimicrobiaceae bacterium]